MPTKQPSFLARHTLGQPNYLLAALAVAFVIALVPRGAYRAIKGNSNNLDAQLPSARAEIADLEWFREQFDGDQFVLVSWDGCTLAEAGKLQRVARTLAAEAAVPLPANQAATQPMFTRVATGPEIIDQLTAAPYSLPYDVAVQRLEGAIVGPAKGEARGSAEASARTTCLAVYLSPWASEDEAVRRQAIDRIREVAASEAHIDPSTIHLVGPGIDAIAIDDASQSTLLRLSSIAAIAGLAIGYWRLRSLQLAALVTVVGVVSAAASLAIVFYFGIFEVLSLGRVAPLLGRADALVLVVPMAAYLLSTLAALRLIYYYRDARLNQIAGAAEHAVADGWPMWGISALLMAAVVGVLCLSDLLPARKFGLLAGLSVIAGMGFALAIVPVILHRFPPAERVIALLAGGNRQGTAPRWLSGLFEFGIANRAATLLLGVAAFGAAAWGLTRLDAAPRLPALASGRSALMQDYAWFDEHVGNAVPMEVVLTVPIERCREPNEPAEADGQQYRLTLEERMALMQDLELGLAELPQTSAVLSPATAMPAAETLADGGAEVREALERHGYVRIERHHNSDQPTGRELWRVSARVAASTPAHRDVDYAEVVRRVRAAVDPVLVAYEQRDWLVRNLHESSKQLTGAKVAILFRANEAAPAERSPEALLAGLLRRSGVANGDVALINLSLFEEQGRAAEANRERTVAALLQQDVCAMASIDDNDPVVEQLTAQGVNVADVTELPPVEESKVAPLVEAGGPRPIRAVYTGMPPVAIAASGELMATLRTSAMYVIPALAIVMMFVARNAVAGLLTTALILFPAAVALGVLGWTGAAVDIGILLLAGVALGVAIEATVNFLGWFRRGADTGLFQQEAARMAFGRAAPAMLDATLIAGAGLLALALSGITLAQQFGLLGIVIMGSAMAASLVVLPAMVVGRLGRFFGAEAAPAEAELALTSVKIEAPRVHDAPLAPVRKDVAAAAGPASPHRARPAAATEERHEAADGPHSALHAKLQRLRRPTGDSPSS